jgi:hypothetical protein
LQWCDRPQRSCGCAARNRALRIIKYPSTSIY